MGNDSSRMAGADSMRKQHNRGISTFLLVGKSFGEGATTETSFDATLRSITDEYSGNDQLPALMHWAGTTLKGKRQVERQAEELQRRANDADRQVNQLKRDLDAVKLSLDNETALHRSAVATAQAERAQAANSLERTLREANERLQRETGRLVTTHSNQLNDLRAAHRKEISDVRTAHTRELRGQQTRFNEKVAGLDLDIKKLQSQLLVISDQNFAWRDERLRISMNELRRLIDNATAQIALSGLIPRGLQLPSRLDPNGALAQVRGKIQFWLQYKIWSTLERYFFSLPFGFGAFGPDAGVQELVAIYAAWRRGLDGFSDIDPTKKETLDLFRQSPLSNKWRSVTFQSLCISVLDPTSNINGAAAPVQEAIIQFGERNVEACQQSIRSLILEISAAVQSQRATPWYSGFEDEVKTIARLAFEIAIQFGVNPACLSLLVPTAGEFVVIGTEYHDCEDGEEHRGTRSKVDLVVAPGLVRVGDGRSEMSKRYPIVPCEIFSADVS
ncbi:hypothetical protein QBC43DRAFT_292264 [Cladorrhinum sp. PSN259]|nr:hypothetical protein QBC43DRAFT_292264 [Cladorrhinum sp. PSN259]